MLIDRDSADAWHTLEQYFRKVGLALVTQHPNDPRRGRTEHEMIVELPEWNLIVQLRGKLLHASRRKRRDQEAAPESAVERRLPEEL